MRFVIPALVLVCLSGCDGSSSKFGRLSEDSEAQLTRDGREHSVARLWNEALLESIRNDFARPTVHARNLWHISAAMYDAWAAYDDTASTWLLGKMQPVAHLGRYSSAGGRSSGAAHRHGARPGGL